MASIAEFKPIIMKKKPIKAGRVPDKIGKPAKKKAPIKNIIAEHCKTHPIKMRLFVYLQMHDYTNWKSGQYTGDMKKLIEHTENILDDVFEWVDNGMPGGKDKDLSRYKTCRSSGLVQV